MLFDHHVRRALARVAAAAVLCMVACVSLEAQTTSASVSGSAKDAQGAVLPGAAVTLTSNTQGTVVTVQTDSLGNFLFPYVKPDSYTLKISLEGFQSVQRNTVTVNANDRLMVGSFTLPVGALTESVTVTGESTDIQLRSGERAYTLQSAAIQNIAVNGRSFFGLAGLVSGVVPLADTPTQVSNLSANGQRANSNNMTVDGVANIDTGDNGGNMAQTNLDAIAEFKVLTSSYQAEYGRAVGAQVQVVTKSGTQKYSGSAYWYARRSAWNSNTWINNRAGTPLAVSSRNDAGFTLGGPVVPKKNLFFFFSQEFQRRQDPVGETRVTVPTALERKGDFSQSLDANGNLYPYIKDYTTGLACGASNTSGCFADGGVLGRIPANRLYAPTLAALAIFPLPNTSGQVGYNYKSQTPSKSPLNQTMGRVDYQLSNNWRLTGRYMFHTNKSELPYGISGWSVRSNVDTINVISDTPGRNWMASTTGILNSTTALEISVGSAHNSLAHTVSSTAFTRAGANMSSLPMLYTTPIQEDLVPAMSFGGGRIANAASISTGQAPFTNFNTTYDIVANLTKVMGSHAAKAGFYFQRSQKPQSAFANFNGAYNFDNSSNNSYDSQHPFANAALGVYNTFQQASSYLKPNWVYNNYEWYLQDNWKTTNNLTLDYGVRFYSLSPQWDTSLQASNFLPDQFVTSKAVRLFRPAVVNGVRVGYDATTGAVVNSAFIGRVVTGSGDRFQATYQGGQGIDQTLTDGGKFRVSPRLGFAYDITGKQALVARGAFGIFYDRPQGNAVFDLVTNPPGLQVSTLTWGLASQVAGSSGYDAPVGLNPNVYSWKVPTVYQWNLGVQWRMPASFILDVSYVGSESRNLLQQRQINALPYGTAYLAASQDPTRGVTCTGCSSSSPLPGGNALPTDLMRSAYPGYSGVRMWEFSAYANYKALQTTVSRRLNNGLMFSANYTRSSAKGIASDDWGGARIDGKDTEANYGPLTQDRPNVFVLDFVYQTPNMGTGAMGYLVNNWQLSGVYRWMSGAPYSVSANIAGVGAINLTGSDQGARIVLAGDPGSGYSSDPYKMFNTAAFSAPNYGSVGLESPRVYMNLPPVNNFDLSVSKSIPLGARRRVEVRLDAFNVFNTTQFSGINTTANFASAGSTVITNLPYDSNGKLTNLNGFGTVSGVRPPRQMQLMARFSF
jgi:Carboxypeptidase regulatory-like domain/TonB-dependent Receptor Plug Domain